MEHSKAYRKNDRKVFRIIWAGYTIILLALFFSFRIWDKERVIDWDISHYYSYLPATFIYGDFTFEDEDSLWHKSHFRFATTESGDTLPVKMTSGQAFIYAPFFLAAHIYAKASKAYEANGFSVPYRFAILFSTCLASIVAFWLMGKVLMLFFTETTAGLTCIIIFTGTNIPYYSLVEPMTHVYSMALMCAMILIFYRYLAKPGWQLAATVGLVTGLILLIRPSNLVILVFPLFLLFAHRANIAWQKSLIHFGIVAAAIVFLWLPQIYYWHMLTGRLLYYSYAGEGFFFGQPEILKGLFSYRKGWFVYSPIVFIAFAGFPALYRVRRKEALAAFITLLLSFYLIFSWWCWWYGGSFGARALIEYLPFMALFMAGLIQRLRSTRLFLRISVWTVVTALCAWSLFMNWQYYEGLIHYDAMTREVFWKQFLHTEHQKGFWNSLDHPDYEAARKSRIVN
jgi:hypothetical protein